MEIPVGDKISPSHKFLSKFRLMWQVPYAPGELKAVAYQGGKQVAVDDGAHRGRAGQMRLIPDRSKIQADGDDLSFVTVRIEDKDGNLCPARITWCGSRHRGGCDCRRGQRKRRHRRAVPSRSPQGYSTGWRC